MAQTQVQREIDSLQALLAKPIDSDSVHVDLLKQLAFLYINHFDGDEALPILDSLRNYALQSGYDFGLVRAAFWRGYYHFRRGQYNKAIRYLLQAADLARAQNRLRNESETFSRVGMIYDIQMQSDSAKIFLEKAMASAEELGDINLILLNLNTLGSHERRLGNHRQAITYYLLCDSIASLHGHHYRQALALSNLSHIHREKIEDFNSALNYAERAKTAYAKHNDSQESEDAADHLIALALIEMGRFEQADSLMTPVMRNYRQRGLKRKIPELMLALAQIKEGLGAFRESENMYLEAALGYRQLSDAQGLTNAMALLGDFNLARKNYLASADYFKQALQNTEVWDLKIIYLRKLAEALSRSGLHAEAYDSLLSFVTNTDSINASQLSADLQEAEIKYETSQKEKQIVDLQLAQATQELKNQRLYLLLAVIIAFLLSLSYFFYARAQKRRRKNQQLKEIDRLKNNFFANISHEFRTPISLITGPIQLVLQEENLSHETQSKLQVAHRNARRLNKLVDNINRLNTIDEGKMVLKIDEASLLHQLKIIGASFESLAQLKKLNFKIELDISDHLFSYDKSIIETIVTNLLANAFKYTEAGKVILQAKIEDGVASISVHDTGIGISEEQLNHIFERYHRIDNQASEAEGIGIGLALSKSLARIHQGSIKVASQLGEGSTFTFMFPIKRVGESAGIEPIQNMPHHSVGKDPKIALPQVDSPITNIPLDAYVVLLVEDNHDMRLHLQSLFNPEYRLLTAANGETAISLAEKYVPDLILSDLMMPVMDGQELLQKVRQNPRTSHIPFVILTANHSEEEKLRSLKTGADDFLTKPFSPEELALRIRNLIDLRQKIRQQYQSNSLLEQRANVKNEGEKQFWEQIYQILKSNLSNEDFTTEQFARAMHMSRMQLHRKLKALTNHSTSSFLKDQRLKSAAHLLRTTKMGITEVAYEVGFSNPTYFTTSFKEQFGVPPSNYRQGS